MVMDDELERLVQLVRDCGYSTGHADNTEMLVRELLEQFEALRRERDEWVERYKKLCEEDYAPLQAQVDALQQRVHLTAAYDRLEAENAALRRERDVLRQWAEGVAAGTANRYASEVLAEADKARAREGE